MMIIISWRLFSLLVVVYLSSRIEVSAFISIRNANVVSSLNTCHKFSAGFERNSKFKLEGEVQATEQRIRNNEEAEKLSIPSLSKKSVSSSTFRFRSAFPSISYKNGFGDEMDRKILGTALPSMLNLAVVPIVNSVDTFWVGRLGVALALAGQAAANQAFFTLYFLVAFLPTITAPLVAEAVGSGDTETAQRRVCEALFLSNLLGALGTIMLVGFPRTSLGMVLAQDAPSMAYAAPYLRFRALSMVPALISATGFAAYRGLLNTVTPLKVSLATNLFNLIADPLLINGLPFGTLVRILGKGFGVTGAAIATALAELMSGTIYMGLLFRKKLVRWSRLLKPPSWESLQPLVRGGLTMLARQMTLNLAFVCATRRAQAMDPTGVAAAAYGIVMQIYSVGVVCHLGIQSTAAALVPSTRAASGNDDARALADRIFIWGTIVGVILGVTQMAALPFLVPMFSTLPQVQEAVKIPALISSFIHFFNGPVFAGEGVMLGLQTFKALSISTAIGVSIMVGCLSSPLGKRLNGILISLAAFHLFQAAAMVFHHLKMGPLSKKKESKS
mmetsp:Transcript_11796/g.15402  ORF Transcript_11796/g.15402 Transcript_11796/m.15402 type:complete len:559 (+) Transcript_11796:51-1727(+)